MGAQMTPFPRPPQRSLFGLSFSPLVTAPSAVHHGELRRARPPRLRNTPAGAEMARTVFSVLFWIWGAVGFFICTLNFENDRPLEQANIQNPTPTHNLERAVFFVVIFLLTMLVVYALLIRK
jgi:hypothetical protein